MHHLQAVCAGVPVCLSRHVEYFRSRVGGNLRPGDGLDSLRKHLLQAFLDSGLTVVDEAGRYTWAEVAGFRSCV